MKGSEGAFPVSGSASQTVNPGISRREWYVGQLIASGRFELETELTMLRSAAIRTMFQIADDLCAEAERIEAMQAPVLYSCEDGVLKTEPIKQVPEVVSGFVEPPVESAAALKDIMAQGGSVPLCGPSWAAAPMQAMKQCGHPPQSWRADWGETEIPVKVDPEAWNPMFGSAKPSMASEFANTLGVPESVVADAMTSGLEKLREKESQDESADSWKAALEADRIVDCPSVSTSDFLKQMDALVDEHSSDEQGRMDALTDLKERGLL